VTTRIAIIGSALGGGAAQIIEALQGQPDARAALIVDNDARALGTSVYGVEVAAATEELPRLWEERRFDAAVIAIGGDLNVRKRLFEDFRGRGIPFANVIDRSVRTGIGFSIGVGNVVLNSTYFGNGVALGNNCYILNQCSVQHDTVIGDHNYLATNVSIGAHVRIGSGNRFGVKCVVETRAVLHDGSVFPSLTVAAQKDHQAHD
jgi:acetyltransferase-like isoleucine patch superfamily enzyme